MGFFNLLEKIVNEHTIYENRTLNVDESNLTTIHKKIVFFQKIKHQIRAITGNDRGVNYYSSL